jgi:tetratricopeptide (TPR) repeat protein
MRMWMQSNRPFERVREELSEVNPIISRNLELGQEYQANSRFTEAIECFNTTLEEDPDNLDAQLGLGECYLGAGNVDQSIEVFTNLLENFGESIRVQLGYCKAYMALGDAEAALEHWEVARAAFLRVLEVNPQHRSATEELVRIFRLQIVQALLEGDIQKTQALLFEAYEKSGKPEEFGIYSTAVQEMSVSDDVRFEILESLSEKEYNREHWDEGYLIDSYLAQQHPETPMDSDRMQSNRQKAQAVLVGKLNHWARTYTDAGEYEKALSFWRRLLEFDLPESDRILKTIHQLEADHIIEPAAPALGNIWRYLILGIVLVGAVVAALVFIPGAPLNSLIVIPEFGEAVLQTDIPTEMASKKRTTVPIGENIVVTSSQDREEGSLQPGTLTDTPTDKPTNIASEEATTVPIEDTIIVTSAQDSGEGSLRQALLHARRGHTITFDPEIFPPGNPTTIFLTSDDLPTISQGGITIDASNAGVILDGSKLGSGEYFGLVLRSDHNTVMGLQIINFDSIGIYLEGGSYNMIGGDRTIGTGPLGQGNLLGKNYAGIDLLSFSGGNVIKGNLIGTDVSGAWPRANMKSGIWVEDNQSYSSVANTIGPDNIIAYNGKTEAVQNGEYTGGIVIDAVKLSTVITANSIYDNTGPGIYYNPKDASLYTYPTSPIIYNYDLDTNTVNGQACAGCVVEIFSTDTQDGKIFEGTTTADTDGNYSFSKGEAFIGPFLTATALSLGESTSEFSQPAPAIFPVQMALDVIQNKEPLYQTSFDTWDFAEPQENASIENGKLIVNSEDQTWVSLDKFNFYSDRFAVEFALQLLEPQHNASCSLNFEPSLDASIKHGLRIMFLRSGEVRVDHPVTPGEGEDVVIGSGRFNPSKSSTFTLIILNNQFIFFVNGELVFTALDPDGSNVYEHGAIEASLPITCEFDSYRFWDLQSMELDQ